MKVFSQYEVNKLNAGPKAKVDVEKILEKEYGAKAYKLKVKRNLNNKFYLLLFRIKKLFYLFFLHNINDIVVFQLPVNKNQKLPAKSTKSIGLIHDIEGLRHDDNALLKKEIELYNKMDVIISHNKIMTKFLKENGVNKKIIELELFDYLLENDFKKERNTKEKVVVFVGNLEKSLFLNELSDKKMDFKMNLYGVGKYNKNNKKFFYNGSFLPDVLPSKIEGDLGLVWDGSLNDKNNNFLNYTRYNNPHKASCYLTAGIPIVVWSKSAVAEFVKKYDVGYIINDIYDINNISLKDYNVKLKNVLKIRKKIINGEYTKSAIAKALNVINKEK